jgi:hypothetical protein
MHKAALDSLSSLAQKKKKRQGSKKGKGRREGREEGGRDGKKVVTPTLSCPTLHSSTVRL